MTYPVKNVSISINKTADEVYQFASNPENFPQWLAFVKSVSKTGDIWRAETNLGVITITMVPANNLGVIDHVVTLADGTKVSNLLRVVQNGDGSEVIFTLLHVPGRTDEELAKDVEAVLGDLRVLKDILERG